MKKLTREWIRKAEADHHAAVKLHRGSDPLHDIVCFHCQQCAEKYLKALDELGDANLASFRCAARRDGKVAGVAPVGEAWRRAWRDGLANPDPFQSSSLPDLWYGINAVNGPPISKPDYHHPGVYGAYLSGLVLFVQMTGADVRTLGASEQAADRLGIPAALAVRMQQNAWLTVKRLRGTTSGKRKDPCTLLQDAQ